MINPKSKIQNPKQFWSFKHLNFDIVSDFVLRISNLFSGFTLIELLVVISIIAVLLAVGMSSFTTAQKKGRDSKRKGDLRDVRAALEQYYSICGFRYPSPTGSFYSSIICPSPGVTGIQIMPTVPSDPRNTPYFCPTPYCTSSGYRICAILESEPTPEYCLNNQQ